MVFLSARTFIFTLIIGSILQLPIPAYTAPRTHTIPGPKISVGSSFACAVDTGGTGWCWGNNSDGQLGDGTTVSRSTAVQISGLSNIDRIHVGAAHVCAIQNTGKVFCWGDNTYGQLGDGTTTDSATPVEVTSVPSSATQIEVGDDSSCAKVGSGAFYCWGRNTSQLGIAPIPGAIVTSATQITALPTLRRIEMGEYHSCGINTTGSMFCWGENRYGQFGANGNGVAPVPGFSGLTNISDFATGSENTCAIVTSGKVYCAGNDSRGTLGNGDADSNGSDFESGMNQPWMVTGITDAVSISMSHQARSACALLSSTNGVTCWGDNTYGQLGDGTTTDSAVPLTPQTELTTDIVRISVGPRNGCALKSDGTVYCWGDNSHGQLGVGDTNAYTGIQTVTDGSLPLDINGGSATTIDSTPTVILTPSPIASMTPTDIANLIPTNGRLGISDASSCALTALGHVWCWGREYSPTGFESVSTATQRLGLFSVAGLAAGGNNTCALLANGRVYCWGTDTHGESGCPTTCADGINPGALIPNLYGATAVSVGPEHACVVTTSATAACWGNNANGQVGDPLNALVTNAYEVTNSASVVDVVVAGTATCAVLSTGDVECWGDDSLGALGDGSTTTIGGTTPVTVETSSGLLTNIVSITASTNSFCALDSIGELWCWGDNSGGQLANGTTTSSPYAIPVTSLTGIQSVSGAVGSPGTAKAGSFCAITNTNITKCWGDAALGNASVSISSTPVTVQDTSMYVSTARSDAHGCAITTAYGITCWGSNAYGQLGDATTVARATPVIVSGLLIGDTPTPTETETPTQTLTHTPSRTWTPSSTASPSFTVTKTHTASRTRTRTTTPTPSIRPSRSLTPSRTKTATYGPSRTLTRSKTLTPSKTPTFVPIVATALSISTETRRVELAGTADARATTIHETNDQNATATREVINGSPSRTRTPTIARATSTPEPITRTVLVAIHRTNTAVAQKTATGIVFQHATETARAMTTRTARVVLTATALAKVHATASISAAKTRMTVTSLRATQTALTDSYNATNEALLGTGTRTRTATRTRTLTGTKTTTPSRTFTPTITVTKPATLTRTNSRTPTITRAASLTATRVAFQAGSVRTPVSNAGHTISLDNATIYTINNAKRSAGGTPNLYGLSAITMEILNTTTVPINNFVAVTHNLAAPNTMYVIGRMTWNTLGVFTFDVSSGTPAQTGFFTTTNSANPTAVLAVGRFLYIGSPKPNPTNVNAPFGTVEVINVANPMGPVFVTNQLALPSAPAKLISIAESEFRIMAVGNSALRAPGSYIIPARFDGNTFVVSSRFTTTLRYTDIVMHSTFKGVTRTHQLFAATATEVTRLTMRESDMLIQPVPSTQLNAIRMPFMVINHLALSPGGSYLYVTGKDPSIDYGMVFAYDLRSTPKIVGFFGEYGFVPSRVAISATKFVMADNTTIITQPQMSTYTGAP